MKSKVFSRLSKISTLHYARLVFRSLLLVVAALVYSIGRMIADRDLLERVANHPAVLGIIWLVFGVEMVLRFFPSKLESMGCQKQFSQNFMPTDTPEPPEEARRQSRRSVLLIAAFWILLNGGIGALYFVGLIDEGILLLICLVFSVCDMICILFFCPFQTWVMKNKCCGSCRIYNWDYAMMFTPLVFVRGPYAWGLLALSLGLLLKWEIVYHRHPERFYEASNQSLACGQCQEKLCAHKKSLQRFLKQYKLTLPRLK